MKGALNNKNIYQLSELNMDKSFPAKFLKGTIYFWKKATLMKLGELIYKFVQFLLRNLF